MKINFKKNSKEFEKNGFTILNILNDKKFIILNNLIKKKIYSYANITDLEKDDFPLKYYHDWFVKKKVNHDWLCSREQRYFYPNSEISKFFKKSAVINNFLKSLGIKNYTMWDDSFGFIGFRLVRPNYNDGYPLSSKSMGFAKKVISCWLPLIGFDKSETLILVKGSNKKKYDSYMPRSSKFEKTDLRLSKKYKLKTISFDLKPGDVIFYGPDTLHSESNPLRKHTRISLEFRYNPK
jgi:hypothetical protein